MKKIIKVALYNPYLDVLGGGEKHILSIIGVLADLKYEVTIFWNENLTNEISNRFNIKNINKFKWVKTNNLKKLGGYDYFFYVTDGSYFFSQAKHNYVFSMVPNQKLYNLNLINRFKLWNYKFISNSPFTSNWLKKWGINSITIPPYIDEKLFKEVKKTERKEKIILTVGRFFPHLHSKNQEKIIETFNKLKKSNVLFNEYKLILVGGLKEEDKDYFNKLKLLTTKDPNVILKPNININDLHELYYKSSYFWHFSGLGVDVNSYPDQVEHFGIAPLEAIASKCLTFCHNSGGPKLILEDQKNAILFNNENDLIEKINRIEENNDLKTIIINNGVKFVKENYNYQIFRKKVLTLL